MKTLAPRIAFSLLLLAGSVPAQLFCPSENLKIEWKAATDALPKKLWIYKSIPQNFSAAVISNAMALASFTPFYTEGDVRKYGQVPKDSDARMFSPYAELEGVAELESKKISCRLLCPILAMEIGKPVDVLAK